MKISTILKESEHDSERSTPDDSNRLKVTMINLKMLRRGLEKRRDQINLSLSISQGKYDKIEPRDRKQHKHFIDRHLSNQREYDLYSELIDEIDEILNRWDLSYLDFKAQ